jgi:hypothetical protein
MTIYRLNILCALYNDYLDAGEVEYFDRTALETESFGFALEAMGLLQRLGKFGGMEIEEYTLLRVTVHDDGSVSETVMAEASSSSKPITKAAYDARLDEVDEAEAALEEELDLIREELEAEGLPTNGADFEARAAAAREAHGLNNWWVF